MIFALAHETPDGGEKFEKVQPRQLIARLLGLMEAAGYKAPEVIALEIMAEVDLWECFDENDEAAKLLIANGRASAGG